MSILRTSGLATLAGALALAGGAAPAAGQIGAIAAAAAVSGAAQGTEYALSGAPVFSESGLVLTEGWSANAFGVSVSSTQPFFDGFVTDEIETTISQMTLGVFAALSSRAMVGAVLQPYLSGTFTRVSDNAEESVSGLGNLTVFGKVALTESANGRTRLAGTASVELPTGDEMVASSSSTVSAGLGVSHQIDGKTSVHGGGSVSFIGGSDGDSGTTGIGFSGAVVRQVSPSGWIAGEILGSSGDGEYSILFAPTGRIRANEQIFIDLGLAFGVAHSEFAIPLDVGLAAGVTFVPGS